jgi:hypothetical protein
MEDGGSGGDEGADGWCGEQCQRDDGTTGRSWARTDIGASLFRTAFAVWGILTDCELCVKRNRREFVCLCRRGPFAARDFSFRVDI